MKENGNVLFQLVQETYSKVGPEDGEDISIKEEKPSSFVFSSDALYRPLKVNIYKDFFRIFSIGYRIDIPFGLGYFAEEDQLYSRWKKEKRTFWEYQILDETFRRVISDFLFVDVDSFLLFKREGGDYIVFYNFSHRQRVLGQVREWGDCGEDFRGSSLAA